VQFDGIDLGTGNLIVENLDFSPNSSYLPIYLQNNNSVQLMFNLSYNLAIKHLFNSVGSMLIKAESNINWTLTPEINRLSNNYSIKFNYPEDWFSFNIFRDDQNITSQIVITENYLYFPNNIIIEGATWKIFAESIPIDVDLYVPKVAYEPDQVLKFSVLPPIFPGNITFKMIDPLGFPEHNDVMEILELTTEEIVLSHNLSSNPVEGTYQAAVFWNNYTAAGLRIQIFYVNIDLFPLLVITFSIIGAIAAVTSFTSYKVIKRVKRNREFYRKSIYNKYMDILNLEYIIVTDKISSLDLFSQSFKKKTLDLTLVSAFLNAIRSFGIEITGSSEQSQVIKLEYQDSKIIMSEYKQFRLIFIMKETPSNEFLEALRLITIETDEKFGRFLVDFDGDVRPFNYVERLLMKRLETRLLYPLKIIETPNIKLNTLEKDMIMQVKKYLKSTTSTRFTVSDFIDKDAINPSEVKLFIHLMEKRIFQPIIEDTTVSLE